MLRNLALGGLCLMLFCFVNCGGTPDRVLKQRQRQGKLFPIFQIVRFENDGCDGGSKNGTCYTSDECEDRGGTNSGSCASGYGVCCTFNINCGATSNENCTYFESNAPAAGGCSAKICPCNNNICQLRLDFESFVISGPAAGTESANMILNGVTGAGLAASVASQCLTDSFSVTNAAGKSSDVICGTNTGQHLYVETNAGCTDLNFQFGRNGVGTALATRTWNIKVTQYSCESPVRAPQGCDQYFFGPDSGSVETFNYNSRNGQHLANQDQTMCVRREKGNCRICYYTDNVLDFAVSGMTTATMGYNLAASGCCGYGTNGVMTKGYDCVQIPGAVKNTALNAMVGSNICGRNAGLVTINSDTKGNTKSICTTRTPFYIRFMSDSYELAGAAPMESANMDAGFRLAYTMDSINC